MRNRRPILQDNRRRSSAARGEAPSRAHATIAGRGSSHRASRRGLGALLLSALALAAVPHATRAGTAPSRPQVLAAECPSRESLRASLLAYADSIRPTQAAYAGQALYFAGQSYARASARDSAILCFQRASELRGGEEERLALADELLLRRRDGDLETALALLEPALQQARGEASPAAEAFQARLAWAELLAGRKEKAYELFRPLENALDLDPVWGYRMARAFIENGDVKRGLAALKPLAVASREQDEEIMVLSRRAFERFGDPGRLEADFSRAIAARDVSEGTLTAALGGRRKRFSAPDGFALSGVVATPSGDKRRRAAIVLCSPRDTLESYDSLTVAMTRSGWAVMLLELRGSGWSAAPACPVPESWAGREDAMQTVCALDVREALRAFSLTTKIDTTRYLLVGVGSTAPIAVEAAEVDDRVPALLLLSPAPAAVDLGTMRERIRRLQRPIYFTNAPEDFLRFENTERLYQAGDRARSRVADVNAAGSGARPLRRDPAAVKRLTAWLEEAVPAKAPAKPRSSSR